jgi:hypothetical protein
VKLLSLEDWGASTTEVSLVAHAAGHVSADVVSLCFVVDEADKLSPPREGNRRLSTSFVHVACNILSQY